MAETRDERSVVILGAGINGAALARELALGGLSVTVVDTHDLAFGATAYSSRLIHGGLRYLEYGEFGLVRESLAERARLLQLAPQFVRALKLYIPVANRFGGLLTSARRFFGFGRGKAAAKAAGSRGLWLVRIGLSLYDFYARDPHLPKHESCRTDRQRDVHLDPNQFPWLCAYYDAQIRFPERFVVALLDDARRAAAETGAKFELYTYHRATISGRAVEISPVGGPSAPALRVEPLAIVNATGAWVDRTLQQLNVKSKTLMGGTKGSHFISANPRLRAALGEHGLYAEAADGRPVFVLPFGEASLVGTTDLPFTGDPADAVATPAELDYLLRTVNSLLPDVHLSAADVDLHYCGVRPLPHVDAAAPAAVTRRHAIVESPSSEPPLYSIVGGKLTTSRSLAEEAASAIRARLGLPEGKNSRERALPGGKAYPAGPTAVDAECRRLANELQLSVAQVQAVWQLRGTETASILKECLAAEQASGGRQPPGDASRSPTDVALSHFDPTSRLTPAAHRGETLVDTDLPLAFVRWVVRHEWVRRLDDLVERRLMLLYDRRLSRACLRQLAAILVEAGLVPPDAAETEVEQTVERLKSHFGKRLAE
ncbi:MAG TPA: glycerol-3-phosphate dehydrogenase/oxidase [Pirellulales bacterium]|nr:glycerol-3-phosphate dehydrogenase/oxidase [Pirellulales bacterium]